MREREFRQTKYTAATSPATTTAAPSMVHKPSRFSMISRAWSP